MSTALVKGLDGVVQTVTVPADLDTVGDLKHALCKLLEVDFDTHLLLLNESLLNGDDLLEDIQYEPGVTILTLLGRALPA
jgi:hypothetical protein